MNPQYIIFLRVYSSIILLILTTKLVQKSSASPIFRNYNCSNTAFSNNSTYGINLSDFFSTLSSKTALTNDTNGLFSDITASRYGSFNNTVYGQYLCQGDYTVNECNRCVANASTRLALNCPKSVSGYIWYEGCTLSFSNVNFQFNHDYNLSSNLVWFEEGNNNTMAANETSLMAAFVATTVKELGEQVAKVDNDVNEIQSSSLRAKYFGTKEVEFMVTGRVNTTLYEMVQCTPDLSVHDCSMCLTTAINELGKLNNGALGGRVGIRSCFVRYEIYRFYKLTEGLELSPSPPLNSTTLSLSKGSSRIKVVIAITIPVSIVLALTIVGVGLFCARKSTPKNASIVDIGDSDIDAIESFQYHLSDIKVATNDFSNQNKIGQGGFGSVYKGELQSGLQIAVKKLFVRLGQMEEEFKNEVEVVAKLQHRNLVRLLGYCLAKDAKLLVFEYVPNKSLDKVLFVAEERAQLDWVTRFKIIVGIARGLLYLHEESRLKIVHRDLKPGNILLDEDMNPKIADFGLARIFGLKQNHRAATNANTLHSYGVDPTHQSTRRGGGTPGYMAPECAERQHFSVKTDVYSFGVLILEIITGKRNSKFQFSGLADDLLSYAWMKWEAGEAMELMDDPLRSRSINEKTTEQAMTCIHIGLLCIQREAKSRPTMGTIVHKLNYPSDNSLPLPQQPAPFVNSTSSSWPFSSSLNECSFSELDDPR